MANLLLKRIKDWAVSITAFRTGDVIPVDGPQGTAKMSKDDLLKTAAENTLNKETDNSDVSEHVDFKNDDETETYARIDGNGVSSKDFKDMAGVSVYDKINAIATTDTDKYDGEDYVEFKNDAEDEVYVRIDKDGINAKGIKIKGKTVLNRIITVAPSGADYTSLTEAIVEACKVKDTEVHVANGTYDIQAEYKALYGNDFFDNMTSSETNLGICLRNGVKVKFDSEAFVVFKYEGSNNCVMDLFSPFTLDSYRIAYNFEIEGLKIKAKNCRYIVHDEMGTMAYPYTHKYKNCVMELDNTESVPKPAQPTFHYTQCIGGGLGKLGNIIIEGCKFKSKDFENANGGAVSYHNSSASDAKSVLNVTGCYFYGGGTFRLSWYGPSTLITDAFVGNNRLGSAIIHKAENAGVYDVHNTEILAWNNQIGG